MGSVVADEHGDPIARAQLQAFSAEDVPKASNNAQRLGRNAGPHQRTRQEHFRRAAVRSTNL